MSMKVLAGFAAALVVTGVGVFAANSGSVSSLFECDNSSPCCPIKAALSSSSCCESESAAAATSEEALGACAGGTMTAATAAPTTCPKGKCCAEE